MWVGVLIGVVAGLLADRGATRADPGCPAGRCHARRSRRHRSTHPGRRHTLHPAGCPDRDGPLPGVRVPARPGWGRIGSRRRLHRRATFPTCRTCSDRQRRMARLSAWWRSSSRSSWPSWSCERSSNGRVDRRSTATSSSSAKARVRSGSVSIGPGCRSLGVTPPRATRARPTWRASRSWRDGPSRCAAPPRRPPSMPAGSAPIRVGPPMGRLAADYALVEFGNADSAAVRASSSDRALAAPSFDRRSAAGQDRSGEAARLTARAGQLSAQ